MNNKRMGELLLIFGVILFVGGALAYLTGKAEQIPGGFVVLALILVGVGASMKKKSKE